MTIHDPPLVPGCTTGGGGRGAPELSLLHSSCSPPPSGNFSRPRRHRRERKAPRAILELSDANFARIFGVILTDGLEKESMFSPSRDGRDGGSINTENAYPNISKKCIS
jgi:hypothetical protein